MITNHGFNRNDRRLVCRFKQQQFSNIGVGQVGLLVFKLHLEVSVSVNMSIVAYRSFLNYKTYCFSIKSVKNWQREIRRFYSQFYLRFRPGPIP